MHKRGVAVVATAVILLVALTLVNRSATQRAAEQELLARTDLLAEFFDGTLTTLSLGVRMLENAPGLHAMNDLMLAIPILGSVAVYGEDGSLIRMVPAGASPADETLSDQVRADHMERWQETVVSADRSARRLRLSRVIEGPDAESVQIAVLSTSIQAMLARLPETLASPVYGAALVDIAGTEFFHFVRTNPLDHGGRCVIDVLNLESIRPQSSTLTTDQLGQMVAGKQLADFPLRLVLTFENSVVLEQWRRTTLISTAAVLVFVSAIVVIDVRLKRQARERARAEQELKALSTDIGVVTDRLETAREELSDLAYVVAHDLKAPLRGISQLSGWLAEDHAEQLNVEGRELLGMIGGRVCRMNEMIEGILSYSRVNRDAFAPQPVDLQSLIETTVSEIALPESVTFRCAQNLPTVMGDAVQLRRLFQNLIDNAARVVTESSGTVSVEVDGADSEAWDICVKDDGPGIDPRHHESIFRPLQTLDGTQSETGTGMGLAICRRIAVRHEGTLTVSSNLGEGTVMTVRLPRRSTENGR